MNAAESPRRPALLSRIAVQRLGGDRQRKLLLSVSEIGYCFTRKAMPTSVIDAPWNRQQVLRTDRVYLRTTSEVVLTDYVGLGQLLKRLDSTRFFAIHQSLIVNDAQVVELDLRGKRKRVGVGIGNGSPKECEWLTISRRHLSAVRLRFGLSARG